MSPFPKYEGDLHSTNMFNIKVYSIPKKVWMLFLHIYLGTKAIFLSFRSWHLTRKKGNIKVVVQQEAQAWDISCGKLCWHLENNISRANQEIKFAHVTFFSKCLYMLLHFIVYYATKVIIRLRCRCTFTKGKVENWIFNKQLIYTKAKMQMIQ